MKYLRTAMRKAKHRKPPSLYLHPSSKDTSPRCSSVLSDWDADDEGFMSSGEFVPSRPLSLSIPSGPYCSRRPTLHEILSNTAPSPWTSSAFMAYLSQNHCLETLEFTMDATRYTKHYQGVLESAPHTPLSPQTSEFEYVRMLWQKLLDAYIAPNGPREVNLPSDVRDRLMSLPSTYTPPDPAELEPAVKIIYELMEESVLVPFLNSVTPARNSGSYASPWASDESMTDTYMAGSLDERSLSPSASRRDGSPTGSGSGSDLAVQSYIGPSPRLSHQSHLSAAFGRGSRLSAHVSGSSATSSGDAPDTLTDDSNDSPSPSASALEPMTPPDTPPTSHVGFLDVSPGSSPKQGRTEGSSWKKMSAKLGFKKSKSGRGSGSSTSGSSTSGSRYVKGRDSSPESGSVIAPMDHPTQDVSRPIDISKTALLHGGTSLKLSEGDLSPVLEAHPGSPVDISDRSRPCLAASFSQRLYHGSNAELAKFDKKQLEGKKEEDVRRDGMAAKINIPVTDGLANNKDNDNLIPPNRLMQVAGMQPFYIPAKISEQEEVHSGSLGSMDDKMDPRLSVDTEMAMDFDFKTENGIWISANPLANGSRSSLATTTTTNTTSTLVDDSMSRRMSNGALTLDTSIASSAASMMSSVDSIQSATTTASSDTYGWEEELDRKESIESSLSWRRDLGHRFPTNGRTFSPRRGVHDYNRGGDVGRRKSLLHRVLNISGSKREPGDESGIPPVPNPSMSQRPTYPTNAP
ncbi:hypothetical protein LOCC1_G008850 [Lachnellula occidentalis]|uniref:RGS domain-containing protein n=1 Tax=Lachnellula occidentalis TaxID=215460 RepID=A0A8H8U4X1_9HELO|nr:hypothetical protein LOCC1_G008850 [Lachnellula occidentalis]